tara:strand:- start:5936 stop:6427 length:492 start_codon:yes stop_codon:yes gene_type:complete
MSSLFEISEIMDQITNHLIDTGGELTEEVEELLIITQEELKSKSSDYAYMIHSLEYDNTIVDQEIKRLNQIKKTRQNVIQRLKMTLSAALIRFEVDEIKTPTLKINFRRSQTLEILSIDSIDKKYHTEVITHDVNKKQIKEDLKNGKEVDGARLLTHQNLQIR